MQLKALIKKKAAEKKQTHQLVLQNYMIERLLERISVTKYRANFIIKGGFLIGALVGIEVRTTMDLDATLKGLELSPEKIESVFKEICSINLEDDINFEIVSISEIRKKAHYPGLKVSLRGIYKPISVPLSVDVTTGDKITPEAVNFQLRMLLEPKNIPILAYNIETILAEKIESIISRNIANTRPRDFYDVYILTRLPNKKVNKKLFGEAIKETSKNRGSYEELKSYKNLMLKIAANEGMIGLWTRYQKDYEYAQGIDFNDICQLIIELLDKLEI